MTKANGRWYLLQERENLLRLLLNQCSDLGTHPSSSCTLTLTALVAWFFVLGLEDTGNDSPVVSVKS